MQRPAALTAIVLSLLLACFLRNDVWKDDGTLWQDTTDKSPRKFRNYNELALHALSNHQPEQALGLFRKALQISPNEPMVWSNMGVAYEALKQWDKALEMYHRAIFLDPDLPMPYFNIGRIYYTEYRQPEKALGWLLQARDLNADEPDVHLYLGYIYRDQGNQALALKEFTLYRGLR